MAKLNITLNQGENQDVTIKKAGPPMAGPSYVWPGPMSWPRDLSAGGV